MASASQNKPIEARSTGSSPQRHENHYEKQLSKKEWQQILRQHGMRGVLAKRKELDDKWRTLPVKICVTGQTGSGKSTVIRRMLGYSPDDPNGPAIGRSVRECTKKAIEYPKKDTGLVYVDLPGINSTSTTCAFNTPEQRKAYCERFRLDTMDYFLLVSQNKFNDNEKILAEYITRVLKKKFIFVQTKMDALRQEFGNQELEEKEGFDAVKDLIRRDIQNELGRTAANRIFLISNRTLKVQLNEQQRWVYDNSSEYEFDLLIKQILQDMSGDGGLAASKVEAFILSTSAISKSAVQETANTLRSRAWAWSTLSGALGAIPIPGVSLICDCTIIISQATDYFHTFSLNPACFIKGDNPAQQVKNLVILMGTSMGARTIAILATAVGITVVEESTKAIPLIGTAIGAVLGAGASFASTSILLRELISLCEMEALKMLQQSEDGIKSKQLKINM